MAVRDFVLYNFRWKLTAVLLAVLVWSVVKFALYKEIISTRNQYLNNQPVTVLKSPEDTRMFRIDPPDVDVVLQAAKVLDNDDVEVFLDLTTVPDVPTALKPVLVRASEPVKVVRTEPSYILVERIPPPDSGLTNSLEQP